MMKVLYLPLGDQSGTIDGFKANKVDLEYFDFYTTWCKNGNNKNAINQQLIEKAKTFQPKLIHMQLQHTCLISPEILAEVRKNVPGVIMTNWSGDVRNHPVEYFIDCSKQLDYSLISSTGQIKMYEQSGGHNIKLWPHGFDPKIFFPENKSNFKYDISFIARNYGDIFPGGPLREQCVDFCHQQYDKKFGLFGTGWRIPCDACDYNETNKIYNDSICVLSVNNYNDLTHYFSDRLLHCMASARPTISWYFPGIEDYFIEDQELLVARSLQDISRHVEFCRNNPQKANEIGYNGYQKVFSNHTMTSRVKELFQIINLSSDF